MKSISEIAESFLLLSNPFSFPFLRHNGHLFPWIFNSLAFQPNFDIVNSWGQFLPQNCGPAWFLLVKSPTSSPSNGSYPWVSLNQPPGKGCVCMTSLLGLLAKITVPEQHLAPPGILRKGGRRLCGLVCKITKGWWHLGLGWLLLGQKTMILSCFKCYIWST